MASTNPFPSLFNLFSSFLDGSLNFATSAESRNGWWSQRDSNPCLSLERAPS